MITVEVVSGLRALLRNPHDARIDQIVVAEQCRDLLAAPQGQPGHSIGSLYQYFPNKDAILAELVTAHAEAGITAVQRHLTEDRPPETLEDRLRRFVRAAIDTHRDDPALHRVLFEEAPHPPELLENLRIAENQAIEAVRDLLAADPEVRVTDLPMAARLVVNSIESLVHRFFAHDSPDGLDRFEDELVAMLVRYLTNI